MTSVTWQCCGGWRNFTPLTISCKIWRQVSHAAHTRASTGSVCEASDHPEHLPLCGGTGASRSQDVNSSTSEQLSLTRRIKAIRPAVRVGVHIVPAALRTDAPHDRENKVLKSPIPQTPTWVPGLGDSHRLRIIQHISELLPRDQFSLTALNKHKFLLGRLIFPSRPRIPCLIARTDAI